MIGLRIVDALAQERRLDQAARTLQRALQRAIAAGGPAAQRIEDLLHGTGAGHPLHPALTDVPLGAWTVAQVLDALDALGGDERMAPGADAAIAIGLAGAALTIATGLSDWQELDTKPLRLGLIHGALNMSATLLYVGSLLLRRSGARVAGRGAAAAGFALALGAAYLGGDLVYRDQIGVSHAAPVWTPLEFEPVLADVDLREGVPRRVTVGDRAIVLVRQGGRIYALDDRCSHLGGPLCEGTLEQGGLRCPWHGSLFALSDGSPLEGPAAIPQPCFETRVRAGQIEVRAAQE